MTSFLGKLGKEEAAIRLGLFKKEKCFVSNRRFFLPIVPLEPSSSRTNPPFSFADI
jgi:hypothetical protein